MSGGKIRVELSLPPSVNALYANTPNGRVMTQEGKAWKREAGNVMLAAGVKRGAERPYRIMLYVFLAERRRDISNMFKITEDTLMGVIHDNDVWVDAIGARRIRATLEERAVLVFSQTEFWYEDGFGMVYRMSDDGPMFVGQV